MRQIGCINRGKLYPQLKGFIKNQKGGTRMLISLLGSLLRFKILTLTTFCFYTWMGKCQMIHHAFSLGKSLAGETEILFVIYFFCNLILLPPDVLKLLKLCSLSTWQILFFKKCFKNAVHGIEARKRLISLVNSACQKA